MTASDPVPGAAPSPPRAPADSGARAVGAGGGGRARWALCLGVGAGVGLLVPLALDGGVAASFVEAARPLSGAPLAGVLGRAALALPLGDACVRLSSLAALVFGFAALAAAWAAWALAGGGFGAGAGALLCAGLVAAAGAGGPAGGALPSVGGALAGLAVALLAITLAGEGAGRSRAALLAFVVAGAALGLGAEAGAGLWLALLSPFALLALRRGARWPLVAPLVCAVAALPCLAGGVDGTMRVAAAEHAGRTLAALVARLGAEAFPLSLAGSVGGLWLRALPRLRALEQAVGMGPLLLAVVAAPSLARRAPAALVLLGGMVAGVALSDGPDAAAGPALAVAVAVLSGVGLSRVGTAVPAAAEAEAGSPARVGAAALVAAVAGVCVISAAADRGPLGLAAPWPQAASGTGAFVAAALSSAPSRAVLVLRSDGAGPAIGALQELAGARPDVTRILRDRLVDAEALGRADLRGGGLAVGATEVAGWRARSLEARARDAGALVEHVLARAQAGGRSVRWEAASSTDGGVDRPPLGVLAPDVPLFRVEPQAVPAPALGLLGERARALAGPRPDPLAARLCADLLGALGEAALPVEARTAEALALAAARLRPDAVGPALLQAEALAAQHREAAALRVVVGLSLRRPERADARLRAARYRVLTGDLDGAERDCAAAAQRLAPSSAAPVLCRARVLAARGDLAGAHALVDAVLERAPRDAEARALAAELRR